MSAHVLFDLSNELRKNDEMRDFVEHLIKPRILHVTHGDFRQRFYISN